MILVYTDACRKKTGMGGYGFIIESRDTTLFHGGTLEGVTNNFAELQAVINALTKLIELKLRHDSVLVYSDSSYFVKGFNEWLHVWKKNGWCKASGPAGKQIANLSQWQTLDVLKNHLNASATWIRGHAGHPENTMCDRVANYCHEHQVKVSGFILSSPAMEHMDLSHFIDQEININ